MKFLEREVRKSGRNERLSYYHAHWTRAGAPLLDELGAVIDHVEAHSAGGASTEGNLATACAKCNGRKSAASMAKWSERPQRKPIKGASEKEWLKILGRNPQNAQVSSPFSPKPRYNLSTRETIES